jgi:hypothetical protein
MLDWPASCVRAGANAPSHFPRAWVLYPMSRSSAGSSVVLLRHWLASSFGISSDRHTREWTEVGGGRPVSGAATQRQARRQRQRSGRRSVGRDGRRTNGSTRCEVLTEANVEGIAAAHRGRPARRAHLERVKAVQQHASGDEAIDVRSQREPAVEVPEVVPSQVIGHEVKDVGLGGGGRHGFGEQQRQQQRHHLRERPRLKFFANWHLSATVSSAKMTKHQRGVVDACNRYMISYYISQTRARRPPARAAPSVHIMRCTCDRRHCSFAPPVVPAAGSGGARVAAGPALLLLVSRRYN